MRLNMNTTHHRRLIINTLLRSNTPIRSRSRIHIRSHKRTVHSSRTHTANRRHLRNISSNLLNTHIRTQNNLIRSRSKQITRRNAHSHRRLTLTNTRHIHVINRRNIVTIQRNTSRMIRIHHPNNLGSLITHNIKTPMNSILNGHTLRRPHILRSRTGLASRILHTRPSHISTIGHSTTTVSLMRTRRRISRHNLTDTHNTRSNRLLTQLNRRQSISRRQLIHAMTGTRILRNRTATRKFSKHRHVNQIHLSLKLIRRNRRTLNNNRNPLRRISHRTRLHRQLKHLHRMLRRHLRRTGQGLTNSRRLANRRHSHSLTRPRSRTGHQPRNIHRRIEKNQKIHGTLHNHGRLTHTHLIATRHLSSNATTMNLLSAPHRHTRQHLPSHYRLGHTHNRRLNRNGHSHHRHRRSTHRTRIRHRRSRRNPRRNRSTHRRLRRTTLRSL